MGVLMGLTGGLVVAAVLLGFGTSARVALVAGLVFALTIAWTRSAAGSAPGPQRRLVVIAFVVCAAGALAAQLVLDSQSGPCNLDDLTGCSSLGEAAVFAWIFLVPATILLALVLAVLLVVRLVRSDD